MALYRDAISPRYRQHGGDSNNRRHVVSGTAGGLCVCNHFKNCRQIQLFARECNVLFLAKLKYVQCLAEFFSQHNVTQVCLFHPTFQKDANYREGRLPICFCSSGCAVSGSNCTVFCAVEHQLCNIIFLIMFFVVDLKLVARGPYFFWVSVFQRKLQLASVIKRHMLTFLVGTES